MDDMEVIQNDKISPSYIESISAAQATLAPEIQEPLKINCAGNNSSDELKTDSGSTIVITDSSASYITSSTTDSSSTNNNNKELKTTNQIIELESSSSGEKSSCCVEKIETPEKLEEHHTSSTNIIGVTPTGVAAIIRSTSPLVRNSPLSREILALQRSLNDSKILTEFVFDTSSPAKAARKARKSQFRNRENSFYKSSKTLESSSGGGGDDKSNCCVGEKVVVLTPEKLEENSSTIGVTPAAVIGAPLARSSPLSREILALQKSLDDSKILSEFVCDTSSAAKAARKARKSHFGGGGNRENSFYKNSSRSRSDPLDISNEERFAIKRSNMRSQNTEFAQKHMDFLSRVMQQQQSGDEQYNSETEDGDRYNASTADDDDERHTIISNSSVISTDLALHDVTSLDVRLKGIWQPPPKRGWDGFCWRCRECPGAALIPCSKCLRCFHKHCIKVSSTTKLDNSWNCPECLAVENALSSPKKTRRPEMTLDMLSELLSFALKRMRSSKGNSKFIFADADLSVFSKYIVNPVTFASLEEKIAANAYRCPEEFYNETKWMVHNAHIITTGLPNNKLIVAAKSIVKVCRQEANEIETCASCYLSANTRSDWFVDVCAQPHLLLWAKLKGFPYWPAKAMGVGQNAVVNVRFFGKHDRAFVPIKDCYLISVQDPNSQTGKRSARELADCIKEVEVHIKKIEAKIGKFNYAPFKTPYDPSDEQRQLELMMPGASQYMKRQQAIVLKPSLQYKIVKTADNNLSIIKKPNNVDDCKVDGMETSTTHDLSDNMRKDNSNSKASTSSECSKHTTTSKYEVITKTVANDSNSPKVTSVILKKRKSIVNIPIINNDGDEKTASDIETSLAKVSKTVHNESSAEGGKISNKSATEISTAALPTKPTSRMEVDAITSGGASTNCQHASKRKQDAAKLSHNEDLDDSSEKHRAKHPRSEPRLPILTIKAGSAKIVEANAREIAENFAKSNTCVTIKKIPKPTAAAALEQIDAAGGAYSSCQNIRPTRNSAKEVAIESQTNSQNTIKEKNISVACSTTVIAAKESSTASVSDFPTAENNSPSKGDKDISQNERNIFRELIPFVEIKQEVNSDDENEVATVPSGEEHANSQAITTPSDLAVLVDVPAQDPQDSQQGEGNETILTKVKTEDVSDDETMSVHENLGGGKETNTIEAPLGEIACMTGGQGPVAAGNSIPDETIRVVGDTTIQRVSARNAAIAATAAIPQSAVQVIPTSTTTTTAIFVSNSASSNISNVCSTTTQSKVRAANRTGGGVPFGPLPASATTISTKLPIVAVSKTIAVVPDNAMQSQHNIQQQQQQQQQLQMQTQRARKSFPNRSPPRAAATSFPAAAIASTMQGTAAPAPVAANSAAEAKRGGILKSTSMVSIPADIAAQRNINQNSVPMPPLTAVSKTTPMLASLTNSIVASSNLPSSPPNSNASSIIGTIAPASFSNTSNTAPLINKNTCNIVQQIGTAAALPPNQTQKVTAPPPLAGLSYTNVTSAAAISSAAAVQQPALPPSLAATANVAIPTGNSTAIMPPPNATHTADTNSCSASTENHLLGDFVTPALANAITEVICRGPPKMARRPNGPLQSDGSTMFPSGAGPVCRTLVQNAHKLTDFFISVMEDTMCDMSNTEEPSLQAKITLLTIELERLKQSHEQEIAELKRTSDLMLCEMRKSMENEKTRIANEIRKQCELERLRCVEEAKRKQWCANCGREAQFYCCWNTSYCDYPCQQQHWSRHAATCAQTRSNDASPSSITSSSNSQQPAMTSASTSRNKATSMNINIQYNKNVFNAKKDKQQNNTSSAAGTIITTNKCPMNIALPTTNPVTNDALKLPTNTYLRPVVPNSIASSSNNNSRASGYNSTAASRYNISLPLKPPVNSSSPYTIVQRGNSWELLTTTSNTAPINTINTVNALTGVPTANNAITTITNSHQQPQQQQQQRSATMATANNKSASRNRGVVSNMGYSANSNANMRATKM